MIRSYLFISSHPSHYQQGKGNDVHKHFHVGASSKSHERRLWIYEKIVQAARKNPDLRKCGSSCCLRSTVDHLRTVRTTRTVPGTVLYVVMNRISVRGYLLPGNDCTRPTYGTGSPLTGVCLLFPSERTAYPGWHSHQVDYLPLLVPTVVYYYQPGRAGGTYYNNI